MRLRASRRILLHGALYFVPVYLVCNMVGGFWEVLFAVVRRHEVNEGFLVTGMLFPLTLAADYSALAGGAGHQFWRGARQGGLWRHRQELSQPGA